MALVCPKCKQKVEAPAAGKPVCPNCGYGAPAGLGKAPMAQGGTGGTTTMMAPPAAQQRQAFAPQARVGGPADPSGPPVPGKLRPVPVGKTLFLGLITFGIYVMVRSFKLSGDLHRMPGGSASWQTLFWVGIFIPIVPLVLYYLNNQQANALRQQRGLEASYVPFILALIPFVNIVAPFVWASHYNELARRT